jgi:hypothetical protein
MPQKSPRKKKATVPADPAAFIAEALKETDELPRSQIAKVVKVLGPEEALGLLAEVERIESDGGMLVPDGGRRRTPGGVFFHLARQRLPRPHRYSIFAPKAPALPAPPSTPPPAPAVGRLRVIEVEPLLKASRAQRTQSWGPTRRSSATPVVPPPWHTPAQSAPANGGTLPSPAPAPANKKDFVLGYASNTPVAEILEAARRQGMSLSASYVYTVRKAHPASAAAPVPRAPVEPVAKAPVRRATRSGAEAAPDRLGDGPTPGQTEVLKAAVRRAVEQELAKLSKPARTQLLATLLYEDLDAQN